MNLDEMKKQYNDYLTSHISNVKNGFNWLCTHLPDLIPFNLADDIENNILAHDNSKYTEAEFMPYVYYFYGEKTKQVEEEFNYAWLHHIHENPHHWQHWILVHDDEPTEYLDMPYEYIIEMICDWWAFSWKTGNLHEIFDWYKKHKDMQLSDNTRKTVEDILDKLKNKLEELDTISD